MKKNRRVFLALLLAAVLLGAFTAVSAEAPAITDGLHEVGGEWQLYLGGEFAGGYTGLYSDAAIGWWLVKDGKVAFGYTGLYNDTNCGWWLIDNARVNFEFNGVWEEPGLGFWTISNGQLIGPAEQASVIMDGLHDDGGIWHLYLGGTVASGYTGLYGDPNVGWWLVRGGAIDFGFTGLYNDANFGWWLIYGGSVAFDYTGNWDDPVFGPWYISSGALAGPAQNAIPDGLHDDGTGWHLYRNGVIASDYTGLYGDAALGWWLVQNGTINFDYTGLWNDPVYGWWLIGGGTVAWDYNAIFNDPQVGSWLIRNGTIAFDYSGEWNDPSLGKKTIKDGKLEEGGNVTPVVSGDPVTLRVEIFNRDIAGLDVTDCWQLKYAQEHFGDPNNITLEFVSYPRWSQTDQLAVAMAEGTAPDLCMTYNSGLVQQCIDNGGIWQLDDLLNAYGSDLKAFLGDELLTYGQSDRDGDGTAEQWIIPARRIFVANVGNFIREDWLEALNMEKPTNIEELTAYLRAAKEAKLGGDNTTPLAFSIYESDPMYNVRRWTDAWVDFSQVNEEDWYAYARNPEMLPGAKEGFRWLNTMYHEGILPATFALSDNEQENDEAMMMGENGFFTGQPEQPWRTDKNYETELEKNVEGARWVTVNPFKNESLGKTLHDTYSPAGMNIIIPKTTDEKTAEAALKYLNWLAEPENMFAMQNGTEGINYEGLTEDGIPYGVKSTVDVPDENKIHANDICFISNGLYYGDDEKNAAAQALQYTGYEEDVKASYADALTDTWTQISFPESIKAETDYGATVRYAQGKFLADVISCDAKKFDEVYTAGIQDILNSGAAEMIKGFRSAFKTGNYRGTFPTKQ